MKQYSPWKLLGPELTVDLSHLVLSSLSWVLLWYVPRACMFEYLFPPGDGTVWRS